jgi:two-component system cell cycle sensor histidine kinase/response regulator CckA
VDGASAPERMTATPTARILFVEDVPADAELVTQALRRSGVAATLLRVDTETALIRAIAEFAPDVIFTDHSLPQLHAGDALRIAEQHAPTTPVIIVTGSLNEETAADYIKAGAADYVLKSNLSRLAPAVLRALDLRRAREEQARAQEELQHSEVRYRALIEQAADAILITNATGHFIDANRKAYELTGYTRDELLQLGIVDTYAPDERVAATQRLAALAAGQDVFAERRMWRKDGTAIMVEVSVTRLQDGRMQGIVRDITGRKRAEAALRESEVRYHALFEGVNDIVFALGPDGTVTSLNAAFERVTGWPAAEWLGKPFEQLVHPDDLRLLFEFVDSAVRGETQPVSQLRVRTRKGDYRMGEFAATPQFREGRLVGVLGIARDITDRLSLEQQLRQAQKMEAVGRLAAGVAHDFNNILTAITGYAQLLLEDLGPKDPHRADVDEIRKAADRAAGLTRQLLAFSRQQVLQPTVLDLNTLLSETESMLGRLLGEDILLATRLAPGLGAVKTDRGQLEQVIMNLAVNARDAMPQGGQLTIETANVEMDDIYAREHFPALPGSYVMVAVSDTGTGMSQDTQAHMFEPFFTTKGKGKGTGLGLATVYGIVKQSAGFIWVYTEPGQGTTFKIYLPRVGQVPEPRVSRPSSGAANMDGTETVLLAEDEAAVRAVARQSLERHGYTVLEAPSGEAALDLAQRYSGRIHLLLTDVVMPGMGGRALALRLAALRPELRTIYMSGYTDEAITRHGVLDPGVAYVQKPFSPDALVRKVREVLDEEDAQDVGT